MYIKSVRAQGFKSFADKLELDFSPGICAIVGPNGSGKSNVVDAILWVLGEQSVKTLRGEAQMSDVIFSGSKTREEQKKASVAILFDNSDHVLNTEFNEVEIKRVIYRSGENEYFINNTKVRLKDITDLLIDVTSKFNIISQGNINALVENKSSERRILFESAAGVLKYKKRKEESLKKLEGTKENLTRVNLIIKELLTTLTPLEEQKKDAEAYLEIKKNLENIEISLVASEIKELSQKHTNLKQDNETNQKSLELLNNEKSDVLEKLKLELIKIDDLISTSNNGLIALSQQISSLESQKQINMERLKFNLDNETIDTNVLKLNEEKLDVIRKIDVLKAEINTIKDNLSEMIKSYNEKSDEQLKLKITLSNLSNEQTSLNRTILELQNKINIEKNNIENNAFMPKSVSSIISNPRLSGIHNMIGNLIEISDEYKVAVNVALGNSLNFIVVDDEIAAKGAVSYLKDNYLGRATFFPISIIKSRKLSLDTNIRNQKGYIGLGSELVSFDEKYRNIIENQLGNTIIVDNMDHLFIIAKMTDYKYKMVSLDGEIIYPGGSISGGSTNNHIHDKSLLNKLTKDYEAKEGLLNSVSVTYDNTYKKYHELIENNENISRNITKTRIIIDNKDDMLSDYNKELERLENDLVGLADMSNHKLDNLIENILEKLSEKQKEREILEHDIKTYQSKKFDINNEINTIEKQNQEINSKKHYLENQINNNNIEISKCEIKMDNLLNILANDYAITYEYADNNYTLALDAQSARNIVNKMKADLKKLNNVNIGSISEYTRLKKRYDFLHKQKEDLEVSSSELLNIISEMDDIMKEKFKTTFDKIASEFSKVFRIMFKGGNGLLKLENSDDILTTGINIMAVPPGKKMNSTASLSGGEKALTAICLIFAILNVKPAPFIVLDEAEAALDEENVNMFGEYLANMKKQSQFILITHKKKMMEYADVLYGVTMQESGVSKLVSVLLEEQKGQ